MPPSLRKFSASEAAQERLKIIQLYDKPGEAECIKYFQVNPDHPRLEEEIGSFGSPV